MPERKFAKKIVEYADYAFSILIFLTIVALIYYSGLTVYKLFINVVNARTLNIVHNIAYVIVLLKAYKILTFYLKSHNLSIKYLVQISIIAPAIEVIFAADNQPLSITLIFVVFGLANLLIYLFFYEKLQNIQTEDI